jgi:hypothetical protein
MPSYAKQVSSKAAIVLQKGGIRYLYHKATGGIIIRGQLADLVAEGDTAWPEYKRPHCW